MRRYGLIGASLAHSFSPRFFAEKFEREGIADCRYDLFPLATIQEFTDLWKQNADLRGVNITIPYKESVLPFLDFVDPVAAAIGAVNVVKKQANGNLWGYNTDCYGFIDGLTQLLPVPEWNGKKALLFGDGGAARAVQAACQMLGISFEAVARKGRKYAYDNLTINILAEADLLVNCTPVGTWPHVSEMLPLPYEAISARHFVVDLIYNPPETAFLSEAASRGATIQNGLPMLISQAERSWQIWNS